MLGATWIYQDKDPQDMSILTFTCASHYTHHTSYEWGTRTLKSTDMVSRASGYWICKGAIAVAFLTNRVVETQQENHCPED